MTSPLAGRRIAMFLRVARTGGVEQAQGGCGALSRPLADNGITRPCSNGYRLACKHRMGSCRRTGSPRKLGIVGQRGAPDCAGRGSAWTFCRSRDRPGTPGRRTRIDPVGLARKARNNPIPLVRSKVPVGRSIKLEAGDSIWAEFLGRV